MPRESSRRGRRGGGGSRRSVKFQFNKRGKESVDKRKRLMGSRDYFLDSSYNVYKAAEKENRIRILPPTWDEPEHYGLDVFVHYSIGQDNAAYLCPRKMKDEDCPICEEGAIAKKEKDDDYAKECSPSQNLLVLVIDRDNEKEGPQIWTMPLTKIEGELLYKCQDRDSGEYINIDDPYDGYDFYFTRKGSGIGTEYKGVDIARKLTSLGTEKQMEEWLELITDKPIPSVLVYYDYEHIKKAWSPAIGKNTDANKGEDDEDSDDQEYTYDDIMDCTVRKLENIALEVGLTEDDLDDLDEKELREEVCKKLGLLNDVNDDVGEDDPQGRLKDAKRKYSNRGK